MDVDSKYLLAHFTCVYDYDYGLLGFDFKKQIDVHVFDNNDSLVLHWGAIQDRKGEQPCTLSSSIHYGGQDIYITSKSSQTPSYSSMFMEDGVEDELGSASRGNWWQETVVEPYNATLSVHQLV
ncbi:hypothetical protein ACFE04_014603 [Oxalis oulophora]